MDLTIVCTVALAIVALAIQPLTAYATQRALRKERMALHRYKNEVVVYRNFAKLYGSIHLNGFATCLQDFFGACNEVALVCGDRKIQDKLSMLQRSFSDEPPFTNEFTDKLFSECIDLLSKRSYL